MSEAFEPLDPVDAAALAEGTIAPDDARAMDEQDPEPGLDSERPVVLEDEPGNATGPEANSDQGLDQ